MSTAKLSTCQLTFGEWLAFHAVPNDDDQPCIYCGGGELDPDGECEWCDGSGRESEARDEYRSRASADRKRWQRYELSIKEAR